MEELLAHCGSTLSQHGNMWAVFFIGGLTGSLTHCLVMCGPVVSCQSACARSCGSWVQQSTQYSYHAGRLLTYGALGFLSAFVGQYLAAWRFWSSLSAFMLVMAGTLFLLSSFKPLTHGYLSAIATNSFLKGMLMGFMPCGLLYAALMMAATLADPLAGMVAMWLFAFGTIPVLLLASFGAGALTKIWAKGMDKAGRVAMALSGISLITTAFKIMR